MNNKYIWQQDSWPNFEWNESILLPIISQARLKQGRLTQQLLDIVGPEQKKAEAIIFEKEAITTVAIEGEKYDPKSVRSSINRRLGLDYAGLPKTQRHIDGLVEIIFDATQNYNQPLSKSRICSWHAALFPTSYSGLNKIRAGKYRNDENGPMQVTSDPIGKEKIHYQAPLHNMLDKEMSQFYKWWKKSEKIDGIIRAGIAHLYFITIHPFDDGNGRIARVITDMALAQDDKSGIRYYSMSSEITKQKQKYYQILESSQKSNLDITEWLQWFINIYSEALNNSKQLLSNIIHKSIFWKKYNQKQLNNRQKKVLNKILDLGKDNFEGGLTTRKYINITKTSRRTAIRDIQDLLEQKLITKNPGSGRSASYDLAWVE